MGMRGRDSHRRTDGPGESSGPPSVTRHYRRHDAPSEWTRDAKGLAKKLSRDTCDHDYGAGGTGTGPTPACGRGGAVRLLGETGRDPRVENAGRQGTRGGGQGQVGRSSVPAHRAVLTPAPGRVAALGTERIPRLGHDLGRVSVSVHE